MGDVRGSSHADYERSPPLKQVPELACSLRGRGQHRASFTETIPALAHGLHRALDTGRVVYVSNHKSHLAYSTDGVCPSTHPVEVPALTLQVYYGVAGGANAELASGGDFSGHADFMNAWNQPTLERLIQRYLNRSRGHR